NSKDASAPDQLEALRAGCEFVRLLDHLTGEAETAVADDQGQVYDQWQQAISAGRKHLQDRLLNLKTLTLDLSDTKNPLTTIAAAGKRLDESAQNMKDAWAMIQEAEQAHDHQQKDMGRGQLQQGLMDTVATIVTLDQCITATASHWNISPAVGTPAPSQQLPDIAVPANTNPALQSPPVPAAPAQTSSPGYPPVPYAPPQGSNQFQPVAPPMQQTFDSAMADAAAQIIQLHGNVTIDSNGRERMLMFGPPPQEPFSIVAVSFHGQRRIAEIDLVNCLQNIKTLKKLDLGLTNITDAGLAQILPNMPQLERLDLDFTRVTDASAAPIGQLTNLTYLNLSRTDITDAGIARLANLSQLETLDLAQTQITDQSVAVFCNLRHLRILQLVGTRLSPDGAAAIRQATPGCLVAHS
ncbi:MAG TPA: leucine-rich repeat domain-containing protein, partial [Tepidisphaeraceae bacterium]|nr:leucine-rich repeat domain-containing protein [Tepidisphaeraceae bacterium]